MTVQPGAGSWIARGIHQLVWNALLNGDSGVPLDGSTISLKAWQIEGTAGAGLAGVIEGSNDGVNYRTLLDFNDVAMSFSTTGILLYSYEAVKKVRPRISAGDGTTAVTVTVVAKVSK